ncbi:nucleoside recognition protein [Lachnospiraceae bacterium ZAX-1]
MLNYLWGAMILIGVVYAALTGNLPAVTNAALDSAKEAVTLCITMIGVMSFWVGLMRIAENSGIISEATKKLRPFMRFMFPNIPREHKANEYITTNIIANVFGLGWAATPAGLKAMEALQELNPKKHIASPEMCTFLIINISSLQLIPVSILAYRSQYGSINPTRIVGAAVVATLISTIAGILFAKLMSFKKGLQD